MTPCPPIIAHAVHPIIHHTRGWITHHWVRHKAVHVAAVLATGCAAGPAVLLHLMPPTIAPPVADVAPGVVPGAPGAGARAVDVPKPSDLWFFPPAYDDAPESKRVVDTGVPHPVPEPSGALVLVVGLGGVLFARRKV